MTAMRIMLRAAALLLAGFAASSAVAADLGWSAGSAGFRYGAADAGTLHVYEFVGEDPVYVRRYWRAPWAHRHFFPGADVTPVSGRHEVLPPRRNRPAEDYFRYWSTPPGYSEMPPPPPPRLRFAPVPDEPPQK